MRITSKMMKMTAVNSLNTNLERLYELQEKLTSGKNISRPSDDPILATRSMNLQNALGEIKQYTKNVEDNISWLNITDSALANVSNILHRAKELAVQGASETLPEASRQAIAVEVDQLIDHVISIGNASYGGRYLFAGFKTKGAEPFGRAGDTVLYNGDSGKIKREISPGVEVSVNVTGQEALVDSGVFDALIDLKNFLENGDGDRISSETIGKIDQALDEVITLRSGVGAKSRRMELAKNRLAEGELNFKTLLSQFQDIDVAEVVMQLKMQENVYQTALAAIARTIQPSLLNFLR